MLTLGKWVRVYVRILFTLYFSVSLNLHRNLKIFQEVQIKYSKSPNISSNYIIFLFLNICSYTHYCINILDCMQISFTTYCFQVNNENVK